VQQIVQLNSGQLVGMIEMILDVPSLLTLKVDVEGSVVLLPVDALQEVLRDDEDLLWNVMYETLTEISRISMFIQAAPFPKMIPEDLPDLELDDSVISVERKPSVVELQNLKEPVEILDFVFGVKQLDEDELREFRVITLGEDSPLYDKGARAVAFWILLEGELDLPAVFLSTINGASIVGELGLLTRQDRSRDVRTISRCRLLRVSRVGLGILVQKDNEVMWRLARPALSNVVSLLSQITVGFEHRVIKSGMELYRAGEPSENLYILINGRLRIVDDQERFRHDVSKPGESVGEMSLLAGTCHSHSSFAVRDSELLVLNRVAFQAVLEEDPQQYVKNLFRMVQERTTSSGSKFGHKPNLTKTVAIMSASPDVHVDTFTEGLFGAIHAQGHSVRLITGEMIESRFPTVKKVEDMLFSRGISYYVHNQEENYEYVLCLADLSSQSVWTRWILRQVDLILLVGYCDEDPKPTLEVELGLYNEEASYRPEVQLVLVHPDNKSRPKDTHLWLEERKVSRHHHLVVDRAADFQRLARVITGNAVGLVLSGGGARGIAHLGAIRALFESGVPIDMVCGTSMGSQVAGLLALEHSLPEVHQCLETFYLRGYFRAIFWDLTFPLVSFMTGEAFSNRMIRLFGGTETQVEDTWLPYFAVSTNLTTRTAHIHTRGPLWEAGRAASSLPLLFPPVICDAGVLMDGGLINNVPVDVARDHGCDIIIAIDVSSPGQLPEMPHSTHMSGWWLLFQRLTGGQVYSSAMEMLLYLTQMVDEATRSERLDDADVSIRPEVSGFGMLDFGQEIQLQLVQRGHSATLAALQKIKNDSPHVWNKLVNQVNYHPSVFAHHVIRQSNVWRRIATGLIVFMGGLASFYFRKPLGRFYEKLAKYLSIFAWGDWLDSNMRF
jgi:predicted acylesterase/phospholipase RssA/CRP-like cAMP-binding protein